jgi:hypothetical protein
MIEPSWKGDWLRLIGFISSSDLETPHAGTFAYLEVTS